jgi:hypothetical protein
VPFAQDNPAASGVPRRCGQAVKVAGSRNFPTACC